MEGAGTKVRKAVAMPTTEGREFFDGVVQFDLGEVAHPSFGRVEQLKSEFPRLLPKFEREDVNEQDIETLTKKLMEWIEIHFNVSEKREYFEELAKACTLFSVYVNPFSSLYGEKMDMVIKIYFWLWYTDDEIEDAIEHGIPFESLKAGTDQLRDALSGNTEFTPVLPNYSFFEPLFYSKVDLHKRSANIFPNYPSSVQPTQAILQNYFEAQRWFAVDNIDERYSEVSFRTWRRIIAYFDGIAEVVAMAEGVHLPQHIRRAPSFQRILTIANSFGGFVNDLIGMKKEFGKNQKDNLIIFKVLRKQFPLEVAVQQVCAMMESELQDYILMKRVVLREFNNDAQLIRYLDILESLIDGHNRMYQYSTRHWSRGCITLTRDTNKKLVLVNGNKGL